MTDSLILAWQNPIFCVLIILSILTLWLGLLRLWQIRRALGSLEKSHQKILPEIHSNRPLMAKALNESLPPHSATGFLGLLMEQRSSASKIDRFYKMIVTHHKRDLWILASIGTLSPFIGLLGTVFGIMHAFLALGQQQNGDFSMLSAGLGEALITTAGGLFVGIEAVALFNIVSVMCNRYAFRLKCIQGELLESIEDQTSGEHIAAH